MIAQLYPVNQVIYLTKFEVDDFLRLYHVCSCQPYAPVLCILQLDDKLIPPFRHTPFVRHLCPVYQYAS